MRKSLIPGTVRNFAVFFVVLGMKKSMRQLFARLMGGYALTTMFFVYLGAAHISPGFWGALSLAFGVPMLITLDWFIERIDNDFFA